VGSKATSGLQRTPWRGSFKYERNGSQYKVYSVSINRRDDQGELRLDEHEWFLDFGLTVSRQP
jgi:hypothetical protein